MVYTLCCFAFQFLIFFLILLNFFKTNFLVIKKLRKILYFAFVVVGTLITPPDVAYQLITSICIIMVYELILIQILLKIELINFNWAIN